MSNFLERLSVSTIIIFVLALLLVSSHLLFIRIIILLIVATLSAIALWEFAQFAKEKGLILPVSILMALGALISLFFPLHPWAGPILLLLALFIVFVLHFRQVSHAITEISVSFFGLLYISVPLGMLLALLFQIHGVFWVIYLIAVTKSTDIGGYFGGKLLGRRKLASQISPSKTIEGALCGFALSLLIGFLLSFSGLISSLESIILALLLGVVSIFSDLSESLLKRDAGKKDSNHLPGLGGVLDFLDSLLFTIPILYFYTRL